ncbi:MAG: glycerol-3-phosphate acyltransferase [Trueperaceae bacterium]|nr:glycerol-3-phosphate acyltransferase [Trueperaceae bacterium]
MLGLLTAFGLGYLIGAVPVAALVARLRGVDIFSLGSGNMGAMNTATNLGYGYGALVLVLDLVKGALASGIGLVMVGAAGSSFETILPLAAAVGAVVGHAWSLYVKFRGGKALATALGTSLPLFPLAGVYSLGLLIAMILMIRRVALASVMSLAVFPVVVYFNRIGQGIATETALTEAGGVALIVSVIIVKHVRVGFAGDKPIF